MMHKVETAFVTMLRCRLPSGPINICSDDEKAVVDKIPGGLA